MTSPRRMCMMLAVGLLVPAMAGLTAREQQPPKPDPQVFKVDVVLTRYQGEKKISSVPYSLLLGDSFTRMRVGVDVAGDPLTATSKEGVTTTRRDFRFLGTSIDGAVTPRESGRHHLILSIQDSSVLPDPRFKDSASLAFRTFSISNQLFVREGQAVPFVVGTDQITGETLRAEVTLTAVK